MGYRYFAYTYSGRCQQLLQIHFVALWLFFRDQSKKLARGFVFGWEKIRAVHDILEKFDRQIFQRLIRLEVLSVFRDPMPQNV